MALASLVLLIPKIGGGRRSAGTLTARARGALWWDRDHGLEQVPALVERRRLLERDRFAPAAVKVMQDGVAENFTRG